MFPVRVAPLGWIKIRWRFFGWSSPGSIAMPRQASVIDVTQQTLLDHVRICSLIDRIVETLIANLEYLVVLACRVDHRLALGCTLGHHLFTQHMLAGVECSHCDCRVRP